MSEIHDKIDTERVIKLFSKKKKRKKLRTKMSTLHGSISTSYLSVPPLPIILRLDELQMVTFTQPRL